MIRLVWPSSSSGYPGCHTFQFGFFDHLLRLIGIIWTVIKSVVGCLAPCVGFRRWLVILPICWVKCLSRLVSVVPLSLRCFGRIVSVFFDSLVSESYLVDFAFFESYRFFFVFDGFFIKFDEWTFCRFGFDEDFVFFGCLSKC